MLAPHSLSRQTHLNSDLKAEGEAQSGLPLQLYTSLSLSVLRRVENKMATLEGVVTVGFFFSRSYLQT